MLKHCFIALTLAAFSCLVGASAVAQDSSNNSNNPPAQSGEQNEHWHGHHQMDPQKRTEMLTKHLNLTSDQQPKVLDVLKTEQSQMQSLHSDSSLSQEDRRSKAMDIRKSTNDQIRDLLTPDQQKKFDEMQSRHEHEHGNAPAQ
jgi:periplasmic protein CpxP/Spy